MIISENFISNTTLEHSYPNKPPGYSQPQILYKLHYEGAKKNSYLWTVEPPFHIISGQGSPSIVCQLMPKVSTKIEPINSSILTLNADDEKEYYNLYYQHGPQWKILGNKNPKINEFRGLYTPTIETYTIIPQYEQIGHSPKYITDPNSYKFEIKNGRILKFYGGIPPTGNPMIDISWFKPGPAYITFYSAWINEKIKYPNTLDILISEIRVY